MSFVVHTERLSLDARDNAEPRTTVAEETKLILGLAVPTVIIQLGNTVPAFLTASHVGRHFGSVYLDGFTLATLTANLFTLSLLQGLYSASDTLSPQAFGAGNYRRLGLLAVRGYVGSLAVVLPILITLWFVMRGVLIRIGENEEAADHAARWYQIYALAIPFYALYQVTWKFLSAQHVMTPLVICVLISCSIVLPAALELAGHYLGYLGTAVGMLTYQVFQSLSLLGYLRIFRPHHKDSWPGLTADSWREAVECKSLMTYMALGAGGMLASSEWIYWETLSLMIGTLGVVPLSVHTIPTQVMTVSFMVPLGVGIALAIRLGATLPVSVPRAKRLAEVCFAVSTVVFAAMSVLMYTERHRIYRLFTTEEDVIAGCEEIWAKVVFYFFQLAIFGVNMGIAIGLGMQWTLGITTIVVLWVIGLPAAWYFAIYQDGGLNVAWTWIWPPYVMINAVLMAAFVMKDWEEIAALIRLREGIDKGDFDSLLMEQESGDRYGSMKNNGKTLYTNGTMADSTRSSM